MVVLQHTGGSGGVTYAKPLSPANSNTRIPRQCLNGGVTAQRSGGSGGVTYAKYQLHEIMAVCMVVSVAVVPQYVEASMAVCMVVSVAVVPQYVEASMAVCMVVSVAVVPQYVEARSVHSAWQCAWWSVWQ
ncbi:hypothetical protein J6590_050918 [Homalodisca vitripennis]|nr:hypothetical protein J6590_050918 [Homalodisca vitripennis]